MMQPGVGQSFLEDSDADRDSEDEEDYVIELIPQRFGSSGYGGPETTSTLDLIAATWFDTMDSSETSDLVTPTFHDPKEERQRTIDNAFAWIAQKQDEKKEPLSERTRFDENGQLSSQKIANLILASLASAQARLPLERYSSGVEKAASAVLEYMWSSLSASPTADTYVEYIKCLEGADPTLIAERAQKVFDAMSNGTEFEGRVLPAPNISVYNSLIQRWAEAGVKSSVQNINSSLKPNRETFLSMLSSISLAHGVGVFDADYALSCIDQMTPLSEECNDRSLIPDIEVYNAPLRCSTGILSASLPPFMRCIEWDAYDEIFQNGFWPLDEGDDLVKNAHAVESWVQSITAKDFGKDISPNIETYESAIQAWVRTGTLKGLQKAEEIAEFLVEDANSGLKPRLQTFHPIILAWLYSGAADGPARVDSWIIRLRDLMPALGG
jgi:hypothetical protein